MVKVGTLLWYIMLSAPTDSLEILFCGSPKSFLAKLAPCMVYHWRHRFRHSCGLTWH